MSDLNHLFTNNKKWAQAVANQDFEFFHRSAKGQTPQYLWIGCADSRVPPNQLLGLPPGQIFVHRNIANVVVHTDLNCLSVIQYAVEVLKVKDIIVCGHYGCGGVQAALGNTQYGLIDNWLRHIKDVERYHFNTLKNLHADARFNRMCELNVIEQVFNVSNTTIVKNARSAGAELAVHGLIYDLGTGLLKDLKTTTN